MAQHPIEQEIRALKMKQAEKRGRKMNIQISKSKAWLKKIIESYEREKLGDRNG